jgi:hypothetical protein
MFVDSMSTDVRVRVDNLMETLFRSERTTLSNSQNFLCTNFRGGATRLMMLSSHHWPGMVFAFLLVLLTPRGAEICSSCFLDEDVKEPDYNWDSAPGLDLDNVSIMVMTSITGQLEKMMMKCKNLKKFQPMTPVPIPQRLLAPSAMSQTTTRVPSP